MNLYINKLFENMGNLLYEEEVVEESNEEGESSGGGHVFRITGVQSLLGEKLPFQDVSYLACLFGCLCVYVCVF